MASSKATIDVNSPSNLLFVLCKQVLRQNTQPLTDEFISTQYQYALRLLGSRFSNSIIDDEFQLAECIKRYFAKQGKVKEAAQFSELHSKLKGQETIKNRWGVLYLLYTLSKDGVKKNQNLYFGGSFDSFASTLASSRSIPKSSSSSGLGSTFNSSIDPTPDMSSFLPKGLSTKNEASNVGINFRSRITVSKDRDTSDIAAMVSKSQLLNRMSQVLENSHKVDYSNAEQEILKSDEPNTLLSKIYASNSDGTLYEVTEGFLLRDIFYVFQGIEGKLIKYDVGLDSYKISNDVGIPLPVRDIICKLAELGWLFRRVRKYLDARASDKALGLVGQSFCAAIEKEIIEYYRLIAVLEAQLNQEDSSSNGDRLTLRRLVVWTHDPLLRMKSLTTLVDQCKGKKGGNLLSAIFSHTQVGDPFISKLVSHILYVVSHPIRSMLERWIFEGDLQDSYNEFFVAADPAVRNERLWHEKYSIRKQMLPSFITDELAAKILSIGKSINFIRVVCEDRSPIFGHSDLQITNKANSDNSENLHVDELNSSALQDFIDLVYENTSKHLLDVLFNKYKFLDHLQAMRRYLLLGQGDFIRHLMDLLEPDLMRPAHSLYMHNLTGLLEAAIRATNAQFDDQDILKRLDCRLLEISPGDCGWDVYSLDYHVDGPISTVFTPDVILHYLRIFNFLWRAKRMEYCLTGIWKNQMSNSRILFKLPEMVPLLHLSHCLEAVMVHFINQMQYFITFEVLECSWEELLVEIKGAKDLDHVINAHDAFLQQVMTRALMDNESRAMLTQLRAIFDLIIQFQTTQETMYSTALAELEARQEFEKRIQQKTSDGKWGITDEESAADKRRIAEFTKTFIPSTRAQIRVLHQSYQDMLQDFLVMLNSHSDVSLRFLCFRLDFNEHYKKLEPKLRSPTKYGTIKGKGLFSETTKL